MRSLLNDEILVRILPVEGKDYIIPVHANTGIIMGIDFSPIYLLADSLVT